MLCIRTLNLDWLLGMSNFEEWDFRRRERIRNTPDWDEPEWEDMGRMTLMDWVYTLIAVATLVGFWGTIVWAGITYA